VEQHMWRRYGDALYTLMTLAIFGFETIALGALSLVFLLGAAAGIASTPVEEILLAVVTSTASALALLTLHDRLQRDLDQVRATLRRAAAQISAAFARYRQFRGVSVDDVDSYMAARP
jgi:hypothetical protein